MDRRRFLAVGAAGAVGSVHALTLSERAEVLEASIIRELEKKVGEKAVANFL